MIDELKFKAEFNLLIFLYYAPRLRSISSLFRTCPSRTWGRYLEGQIHLVRLTCYFKKKVVILYFKVM